MNGLSSTFRAGPPGCSYHVTVWTALFSLTFAIVSVCAPAFSRPSAPSANRQSATPESAALSDLLAKAQSDIDNQDYAAAAEKYEAYLAQRPQDAQIHFQLGYCYTALQESDQARNEYEKATELDPKLAAAFLNLGLTELPSDPAAAVAPLERAAELMPDQERPKLLLATALAHSGKIGDAIVQFQAAEKIAPNDAHLHRDFGAALLDAHRAPDGEKELRAAVALDAQDAQANLLLGQCLLEEKKNAQAVDVLRVYLRSQPADDKVRFTLASALIDASKYDEALAELNRATPGGQQSLASLKLRFDALEGAKRYDDARAVLAKAEAIAPQEADIHAKMARLYLDQKAYASAAQEFISALKIQPRNNEALAGLVSAEYLAKDYPDALQAIDLLSRQAALSQETLFIRADSYDKLGKKPQALDAYEKFLAANTDRNSDMYFAAAQRARVLRREIGKK